MKKLLVVTIMLASLIIVQACNNTGANQQGNTSGKQVVKTTISPDDFEKKLAGEGVQLVDVRTAEEYKEGHLKNAVNIDIRSAGFTEKVSTLDKNKPVLVYCLAGSRSASAANKMADMGFTEIYNLDGGIMSWTKAGKPTEGGEASPRKPGMTMDAFNQLTTKKRYVLVDFNAKWCEPCLKMNPYLDQLAIKKTDKMFLARIDADENKELLKQKNIPAIPYFELYKDGKLVWTHQGYIEESQLLKETQL
jgi:rhodanese-related sulfurtransferase